MPRDPIVGMTVDVRYTDGRVWPAVVTAVNGALVSVRFSFNPQTLTDIPLIAGSTFYQGP